MRHRSCPSLGMSSEPEIVELIPELLQNIVSWGGGFQDFPELPATDSVRR